MLTVLLVTLLFLFISLCSSQDIIERQFNCVYVEVPPYTVISNSTSGTLVVSGFSYELLETLLFLLGIRPVCNFYSPADGQTGTLNNGTWSGAMREMVEGRADFYLGPLLLTPERYEAITVMPYSAVGDAVMVRQPIALTETWGIFKPFSAGLWVTIIATCFIVGLLHWAVDVLSYYGATHLENPHDDVKRSFRDIMFNPFMAAVGAGSNPGRSISTRLLLCIYVFVSFIIVQTYTANLASFLLRPDYVVPIDSFTELKNSNISFATVRLKAQQVQQQYPEMMPRLTTCENITQCLQYLLDGKVDAVLNTNTILNYYANQEPCDSIVVGPTDLAFQNFQSLGMRKGLFDENTTKLLNDAIVTSKVNGLLSEVWAKWQRLLLSDCSGALSDNLSSPIDLHHIQGIFYLLLIGMGSSLLLATFEGAMGRRLAEQQDSSRFAKSLHYFLGGGSGNIKK